MIPVRLNDPPTPAPQPPYLRKAKATPPLGKATAQPPKRDRPKNDRPPSAPLPLSQREQQVCEYLSQGMSFETIANHLNCSPAAARAYYRRALSKRQRTIALASHEQGDSSAPRVRKATAKPEPALEKVPQMHRVSCRSGDARSPHQRPTSVSESSAPRERPSSASASICNRSPFHSPAVDALAFRERPNAIDLCIPSLFVEGESVTDLSSGYIDVRTCQINLLKIPKSLQSLERLPDQSKALEGDESAKGWDFVGRLPNPQTIITDPPRHPFRRKRYSRRSRRAGVGFRVAIAS